MQGSCSEAADGTSHFGVGAGRHEFDLAEDRTHGQNIVQPEEPQTGGSIARPGAQGLQVAGMVQYSLPSIPSRPVHHDHRRVEADMMAHEENLLLPVAVDVEGERPGVDFDPVGKAPRTDGLFGNKTGHDGAVFGQSDEKGRGCRLRPRRRFLDGAAGGDRTPGGRRRRDRPRSPAPVAPAVRTTRSGGRSRPDREPRRPPPRSEWSRGAGGAVRRRSLPQRSRVQRPPTPSFFVSVAATPVSSTAP